MSRRGSSYWKKSGATTRTLPRLFQKAIYQYKSSSAIWYQISDDHGYQQSTTIYVSKEHGVAGDGSTDDSAAIQALIDTAPSTSDGRVLVLKFFFTNAALLK